MKNSGSTLKKGKTSKTIQILGFQGDPETIHRLQEMGLRNGQEISIEGQSPFGGPVLVKTSSTVLALREEEYQCLIIK